MRAPAERRKERSLEFPRWAQKGATAANMCEKGSDTKPKRCMEKRPEATVLWTVASVEATVVARGLGTRRPVGSGRLLPEILDIL